MRRPTETCLLGPEHVGDENDGARLITVQAVSVVVEKGLLTTKRLLIWESRPDRDEGP